MLHVGNEGATGLGFQKLMKDLLPTNKISSVSSAHVLVKEKKT